jgi:hypothetical protein
MTGDGIKARRPTLFVYVFPEEAPPEAYWLEDGDELLGQEEAQKADSHIEQDLVECLWAAD